MRSQQAQELVKWAEAMTDVLTVLHRRMILTRQLRWLPGRIGEVVALHCPVWLLPKREGNRLPAKGRTYQIPFGHSWEER